MVRIGSDSVCPRLRTTNASLLIAKVTVKSSISVLCWSQMGKFTFQSSTCVTITSTGNYKLRIVLVIYSSFKVGSSATNHKLNVGAYSGDAGELCIIIFTLKFFTVEPTKYDKIFIKLSGITIHGPLIILPTIILPVFYGNYFDQHRYTVDITISVNTLNEQMTEFVYTRKISSLIEEHEHIPYWLFRKCAGEIKSVTTSLINAFLSMGVVSLIWKQALVTPVLKVKKISDFTGFKDLRGVSVTSILSRVHGQRILHISIV